MIDYDKQGERGTTNTLRRLSWGQEACIVPVSISMIKLRINCLNAVSIYNYVDISIVSCVFPLVSIL